MNIAYQNRVRLPAKIRVFSDFLIDYVRENSDAGIWIDSKGTVSDRGRFLVWRG
jgi:hypothetical protein